jgi:hypothetical protein
MFQTKVVEQIKTHIFSSVTPHPRNVPFMGGLATGDSMAHALRVLDN